MLGHDLRSLRADTETRSARDLAAPAAWWRRSAEEQWLALNDDEDPILPGTEPNRGRVRVGLLCPCLGQGGAEAWQLALARVVDPAAVVWRGAVVTAGRRTVASAMLGPLAAQMPVGFGLAARALAVAVAVLVSWTVLDHRALTRVVATPPGVALDCHFPDKLPWTVAAELLPQRVDRRVAESELALDSLPAPLRSDPTVNWDAVAAARLEPTPAPAATRRGWEVPADARVAGFLGRLAPEKNPAAMLRLAEALLAPWDVTLVGDGCERTALPAEVDRLGLERVHLVPRTAAAGDARAAFATLVVPSRFESFGLAMAEGFWLRVPVVAPRVGLAKLVPGLVREVEPDPTGGELARAILLDDGPDAVGRAERVARARRFAGDRLGLARFGREWPDLIGELGWAAPALAREEAACGSNR